MTKFHTAQEIFDYHISELERPAVKSNLHAAALAMDLLDQAHVPMAVVNQVVQLIAPHVPREVGPQKRIIMAGPVPEAPGSLFPKVNVTAIEAEHFAVKLGGRLPTSAEYDELFKIRPWPHLIFEWTGDIQERNTRALRGGSWLYPSRYALASRRSGDGGTGRVDFVGFRVVKVIGPDEAVPDGWVELPNPEVPEGDLLEATSAAKEEAEAKVKALEARALKAEAILAELERMAEAETRGIEYEHQDELMGIWCHDYEPCLTHRLAFAHAVVGRKNE